MNCSTCKHWTGRTDPMTTPPYGRHIVGPDDIPAWGICKYAKPSYEDEDWANLKVAIWDIEEYNPEMRTRKDFSCSEWSSQ